MNLLLSSKGLANEELAQNFLSFVGLKRNITIITTVSQEYKEENINTINLKSKLNALGFNIRFVDIEFEDPEILMSSEIIIITGGNPYYLLHHIKKSKAADVIHKLIANQIPIWGISAGFMILMKDLGIIDLLTPEMNTLGLKDKECLGIIDVIVIPHYDRFINEGKIQKFDIDKFEKKTTNKIIRLGEFQCLRYQGDQFEKIGELMT